MAQPRDFGFGSEEQMVRDGARKLLRDELPVDRLRTLVAGDHHQAYESEVPPNAWEPRLWESIVGLGWTALWVPESAGGVGMKMVAVAALVEEVGRAALPSPLPATLCATAVLRAADETAAQPWLEQVASGTAATLAWTNAAGSWAPTDTDVTVGTDGTLSGTACFVQEARKTALFVVVARGPEGVGLYVVPKDTAGITITPDRIVDLTRDQAHIRFDGVKPAAVLSAPGTGDGVLAAALPAILTIVAADLCGAAEWQLQTTTEYARVRTQFEKPIGFFQAVKHPIVNMMMAIDRARSITYAAACALDTEPEAALRLARMAKAAASDTAAFCSDRSVQLHGGIGFTWECDVHIWFKRQKHNQVLYGDGPYQRAQLARLY
ncbi:MAG TPA: acyl-CoA dehydrogenase family protein [Candidatus Binatia bacterium]|jgi:alkylation response protein AidB-like acyl-CoA dehydrogenase|nr:acyl-CoA dehydrogenase family protein [Candidatus Binatia bacterium]